MRTFHFVSYLVLYCWSGVAKAGEPNYFAAYLAAEISKCELRNLQSYWKLSTEQETKIAIGKKVFEQQELLGEIRNARTQAVHAAQQDCDFWSLDFSYNDAEVMAAVWGTDTYEAKMKIAREVASSSQQTVKKMIKSKQGTAPTNADPVSMFFAQGYDYCHAKMVGKAYGVDTYETKSWLGGILQQGDKGLVEQKLAFARGKGLQNPANACSFLETDFTPQDAEKLAKMWKVSYEEAKIALVNKYLHGLEKDVMEDLR